MRWVVTISLLLAAQLGFSQAYTTERFDTSAKVNFDRSVNIQETIVVNFKEPRRGIQRTIPFRNQGGDVARTATFNFLGATANGKPVPMNVAREGGEYRVRLGDANRTVTGRVAYVFRYQLSNVLTNFPEQKRVEFFWNLIPHGWNTAIPQSTVTIETPPLPSGKPKVRVLYGPAGESQRAGIELEPGGNLVGRDDLLTAVFQSNTKFVSSIKRPLSANWGITVVYGMPTGTVEDRDDTLTQPMSDFSDPGQSDVMGRAQQSLEAFKPQAQHPWGVFLPFLPLLLWLPWLKKFKTPKMGPLVTRFEAPDGVTPSETGGLMDLKLNPRDVVAGMIAIAQAGYATMTTAGDGPVLEILDRPRPKRDLDKWETELLEALRARGPVVSASSLRDDFAPAYAYLSQSMDSHLDDKGYTQRQVKSAATAVGCIGLLVIIGTALAWFKIAGGFVCFGLPVALLILAFYSQSIKPYSPLGARKRHELLGLREFIDRANRPQIEQMLQTNASLVLFEELLPYAIAFGMGSKWIRAFEGIDIPRPDWYVGPVYDAYWYGQFGHDLNNASDSWTDSVTPPVVSSSGSGWASGDSGFGSGGFSSGGGFDGGGGFSDGGSSGGGGGGGGGGDW
ncbi:MAG TPA: DUF2207 domain-containing protein [Fimbriimonadaceae bacterium]|nr:DUF2207 domain-containing protein [Fimbriimonadaceae bacterium]